ncbi:MAG: asparaginase, partial [Ilumatobacteraceae bacterium]
MTVHVIATGGTISSHWDGSAWHNLDGHTLVAELEQAQPGLTRDVEVTDVAAGPSSNLSLADMYGIAGRVADALDAGATGVVVVHGTDTIELTAFATQMVLGTTATRRPVVFTGSMRVHSHPAPDGPRNLVDAITVASSEAAIGREVLVCMDGRLHAADRVRKRDASSMDAFDSGPLPAVGSVAGGVVAFAVRAQSRDALGRVDPRRLPLVPLVLCAPGLDADAVTASLG